MPASQAARVLTMNTRHNYSVDGQETASAASAADSVDTLALVSPTTDPFTSLPRDVLSIIIDRAGGCTRLALFRTCKQLRDALASQAVAGWSKQLQTRLFSAPGDMAPWWVGTCLGTCFYCMRDWHDIMSCNGDSTNIVADWGAVCALAQLDPHDESTGSSDSLSPLHLHLAAAAREGTQALQKDPPAPAQSMISFLFSQWPTAPLHGTALQHITCIRLEGVLLDHALPECIGRSCPALREYHLFRTKWCRALWSVRSWPQLQRLTLDSSGNVKPYHGALRQYLQFNTNTLPGLCSLHVRREWGVSDASSELHHAYAGCCAAFSSQLTSLTMDVHSSYGTKNAAIIFLSMPSLALPQLTTVVIDAAVVTAAQFAALLQAAPMLTHLKVQKLSLTSSCADMTCGLRSFVIAWNFTPFVPGIARLPHMPQLTSFDLPKCDYYDALKAQPQDVAAAVKVLLKLPPMESPFRLHMSSFCVYDRPYVHSFSVTHLSPLLDVVNRDKACISLHCEDVTEAKLRALAATGIPRIRFESCSMVPPTLPERILSLMPEVNEVEYTFRRDSACPLNDVLRICRNATRPVTVVPIYSLKDEVRQTLQAEGNTLVTVK